MTTECWVEVTRKDANGKFDGYCVARIRADFISAIIEVETKDSGNLKKHVRLHLGTNNFVDCQDETLASIWNKMNQAMGRKLYYIRDVSPGYPGHPDYDSKPKAVM